MPCHDDAHFFPDLYIESSTIQRRISMGKKGMKRRDFLGSAAVGIVGAGVAMTPLRAQTEEEPQKTKFIFRSLGKTGVNLPIVSFGVMNSDSPDLLNQSLDMGIKHLDSAHGYLRGNSERVIGEVLEQRGDRSKIIVSTKMYMDRDREKKIFTTEGPTGATEENFFKMLEISLERLRTDYVDILYLHSTYSPEMVTHEAMLNALVKAKKQGKTRFIGCTTHSDEHINIRAAVDTGVYEVIQTAYNFVQEKKEDIKDSIAYAAKKGIGIVAMKTQGGRRLQQTQEVNHTAALKWVLNDENVTTAIPGMTTFNQLDLNMSVMNDLALSRKEKGDLASAATLKGLLYCQQCRACVSTCPSRAEIPDMMRAYMYAEAYKNHLQAVDTIAELPRRKGLDACRSCTSCTARCANGIKISQRINKLISDRYHLG
jgi:predicted aldo/keto reductase-like oxidoreductase